MWILFNANIIICINSKILSSFSLIRWRSMFGIAVIPSVLLALGMAISPESPRWLFQVNVQWTTSCFSCGLGSISLISFYRLYNLLLLNVHLHPLQQGKLTQAEASLRTLYGKERVAEAMQGLQAGIQGSTEQDAGWFDLFSKRYGKGMSKCLYQHTYFIKLICMVQNL